MCALSVILSAVFHVFYHRKLFHRCQVVGFSKILLPFSQKWREAQAGLVFADRLGGSSWVSVIVYLGAVRPPSLRPVDGWLMNASHCQPYFWGLVAIYWAWTEERSLLHWCCSSLFRGHFTGCAVLPSSEAVREAPHRVHRSYCSFSLPDSSPFDCHILHPRWQ